MRINLGFDLIGVSWIFGSIGYNGIYILNPLLSIAGFLGGGSGVNFVGIVLNSAVNKMDGFLYNLCYPVKSGAI